MRVVIVAGPRGGVPSDQAPRLAAELGRAVDPAPEVAVISAADALPAGPVDCLVCSHRYPGLAHLPDAVRWVQVWGTGVDGMAPEAFGSGRVVTCARGAGAVPISEFVLASMLAVEKHLPDVWVSSPPARWYDADLGGLHGRTLAVVGLGAIGSAVARLALAFSMSVRGLRAHGGPSPVPGAEVVSDVGELVTGAHHVVVCAPATPATHHLLSAGVFARMGPGAHLVNIARGSLVDHEALHRALDDGSVGWASLDVTDPEPLPAGHWLYAHPRVRVSPHVSWSSHDGHDTIRRRCLDNVVARAQGRPLAGVVDRAAGY